MKRMLFNATYQEELRVATVDGQRLVNFDIETSSKTQRRGNIYKGVITRVESSLEACFVNYGTEKHGFLPFKEIDSSTLPQHLQEKGVSGLTEGVELIVQVEKDERGNKGAALTTKVSLPGRYLVLMPSNPRSSGISRRIDGDERDELKQVLSTLDIPGNMSVIARTAALGRVNEELQWDLNYLLKLWEAILSAASSHTGSFLIYQESNLVVRSIRDHFSPDITEILIDTKEIFEQAKQFISHVIPTYADRVKLYTDDVPLFSRFQIEHQIESAYGRVIHLPSGGSIVIDLTEALTAIDVNSAKANKGADIEATALATNLEAAEEIARQMRLRDLGGLVVVDFIDMESMKNQREVENSFRSHLAQDRARVQMSKLSKFGLLELSRQRLQSSLEESTTIECPRCAGVGTIRGIESTAIHILRIVQEEAVRNSHNTQAIHVQLPIPIATYLLNEKKDDVAKIEARINVKIILVPNMHLDSPQYKIKKISTNSNDSNLYKASFNLVDNSPLDENDLSANYFNRTVEDDNKAVIKNFTPSQPAPVVIENGLFGKFLKKIKKLFDTPVVETKKPQNKSLKTRAQNPRQPRANTSLPKPSQAPGTARSATRNPRNERNLAKNRPNGDGTNNRRSRPKRDNESLSNSAENRTFVNKPAAVATPNTEEVAPTPRTTNISRERTSSLSTNDAPVSTKALEQRTHPKPVAVVEKIDLGELQMVATSATYSSQDAAQPVIETNAKRYSDLVKSDVTTFAQEISYEQIETK